MLMRKESTPARFRRELMSVPTTDRDAWLDLVFELDALPDDGPDLPRGCVPYIPCAVDSLLRAIDAAAVQASDVFVDVGSGVGRTAALVHLLTGAQVIGLEIQAELIRSSRELMDQLSVTRFLPVHGDATELTRHMHAGSVFFLYCPFGSDRLAKVMDGIEDIARTKDIRICCVDMTVPPRPWLVLAAPPLGDLTVYRSSSWGMAPSGETSAPT
jgi:SAM-dependent methyltransferase